MLRRTCLFHWWPQVERVWRLDSDRRALRITWGFWYVLLGGGPRKPHDFYGALT